MGTLVWVAGISGGGGRGGGGTERFPCSGQSTFSTKSSLRRKQVSEHEASCALSTGIVGGSVWKKFKLSLVSQHIW